jgi:hypothetical protein
LLDRQNCIRLDSRIFSLSAIGSIRHFPIAKPTTKLATTNPHSATLNHIFPKTIYGLCDGKNCFAMPNGAKPNPAPATANAITTEARYAFFSEFFIILATTMSFKPSMNSMTTTNVIHNNSAVNLPCERDAINLTKAATLGVSYDSATSAPIPNTVAAGPAK